MSTSPNPLIKHDKGHYEARHKLRIVTAASLFDGHDAGG